MATEAEVRRYGRDLLLPVDGSDQVRTTATGDLRTTEGAANVRQAQRNRAVTTPGELRHRPEYGGGVALGLEAPATPAERARLTEVVRRNALLDDRIVDATVSTAVIDERVVLELGWELTPVSSEPSTDLITISLE